jgi:DNA repair exonuclease SbcCD ATPase subunit
MSEVIIKNKYLDFGGLQKYDALIKGLIATGNKELADAIAALDAKIGNLNVEDSDAKNLAEIVDGIYASIADIVETQVALEEKDADLAAQIKKVADDLQFVTGGDSENEATIGEINAKLEELKGSVDKVAADAAAAAADAAQAKTDAAAAVEAAGQAQADAATAVADAAQAKEDAAVAAAAVETLVGEGDGSVKKIAEDAAAEAVAAVVAGAESDFDTLKEVAEWISADKEGSAALQATVSDHTTAINTINGDIDALEAKVDDDIANLTNHMSDAATALAEVDRRLEGLEAFEETHESIPTVDIEGLFA